MKSLSWHRFSKMNGSLKPQRRVFGCFRKELKTNNPGVDIAFGMEGQLIQKISGAFGDLL